MPVIRIAKRERAFAQIDKRPLENPQLSWRAKGLLAYFMSRPDDWQIQSSDLLKRSTEGRLAVRRAMKELRDAGHAVLRQVRSDNGSRAIGREWCIYEEPISERQESRLSENLKDRKTPLTNKELLLIKTTAAPPPKAAARAKELAEKIYSVYPRKVGKPAALKAIVRALDRIAFRDLLVRTAEFARLRKGSDMNFCPYPATWYHQERFNDAPATWVPARQGQRGAQRPASGFASPPRLQPARQVPEAEAAAFAARAKDEVAKLKKRLRHEE